MQATPTGEPGLHYLCRGYQEFFRHVDRPMRVMAAKLRQGEGPAGVMQWHARNVERAQRLEGTRS